MIVVFNNGIALGIRHVVQPRAALGRKRWRRSPIGLLLAVWMRTALDRVDDGYKGHKRQQQGEKGGGEGGGWVAALPHHLVSAALLAG